MALKHISMPDSPQGVNLALTAEQEENCKVLYKNIKDNLYEFAGFYNPEIPDEEYPDGLIAIPVRSVLKDVCRLKKGTKVWNVIGSTGDPWNGKHANWIMIWESELRKKGIFPVIKCYVAGSANIRCNNIIYGGHIVLTNNTSPPVGSNNTVYIVPICNAHNNRTNTNQMNISEDVWALLLNKYHTME